jgi:hypothetical protein
MEYTTKSLIDRLRSTTRTPAALIYLVQSRSLQARLYTIRIAGMDVNAAAFITMRLVLPLHSFIMTSPSFAIRDGTRRRDELALIY